MNDRRSNLFISWIQYHGRSQDLADELNFTALFVDGGNGPAVWRYLSQALRTTRMLISARPKTVAVMLPPLPLLVLVKLLGLLYGYRVVADLHSGVFLNPKWTWAKTITLYLIRKNAIALVTNETLRTICEEAGVRALTLHDLVLNDPEPEGVQTHTDVKPFLLVPLSYANDEPVEEILQAAALDKSIIWKLTGAAPADVKSRAGRNVLFQGYVNDEEYRHLMRTAAAVVALTKRPHTMQRAGYEAMIFNKALVTSDFIELREFFHDAAEYARPIPDEIVHAARSAAANAETSADKMRTLQSRHSLEQKRVVRAVAEWSHGKELRG